MSHGAKLSATDSRTDVLAPLARASGSADEHSPAGISKEVREAYSGLLSIPAPKSDADFRRAIMMAVLIGREIEHQLSAVPNAGDVPRAEKKD